MVARNGKYGAGIVPIRIVELIVIPLFFAEVVYQITQVKEKDGTV
jgi:hypothetical protein